MAQPVSAQRPWPRRSSSARKPSCPRRASMRACWVVSSGGRRGADVLPACRVGLPRQRFAQGVPGGVALPGRDGIQQMGRAVGRDRGEAAEPALEAALAGDGLRVDVHRLVEPQKGALGADPVGVEPAAVLPVFAEGGLAGVAFPDQRLRPGFAPQRPGGDHPPDRVDQPAVVRAQLAGAAGDADHLLAPVVGGVHDQQGVLRHHFARHRRVQQAMAAPVDLEAQVRRVVPFLVTVAVVVGIAAGAGMAGGGGVAGRVPVNGLEEAAHGEDPGCVRVRRGRGWAARRHTTLAILRFRGRFAKPGNTCIE